MPTRLQEEPLMPMPDLNAVKRLLIKQKQRGASDAFRIAWLKRLKKNAWYRYPEEIDFLISAIRILQCELP